MVLEDGSRIDLAISYRPGQLGWFADLTYGAFELTNFRLTCSANALRQYRALIPFGLAVVVAEGREPFYQTDLSDGSAQIYLLDAADVARAEQLVFAP